MSKINFKRGDLVEVRDSETQEWQLGIFVSHMPNTKYPYYISQEDKVSEKGIQHVMERDDILVDSWMYCRKASKFPSVTIKLNNAYYAVVSKDFVKVGCQIIPFDAVIEVYNAVMSAKDFVEPE